MGGIMYVRGIRGATSVEQDTREEIHAATKELLIKMVAENKIAIEDIASVFFTVTPDLIADFPAYAARELGWTKVPLICMKEIEVPNSLPMCVRVLIHVNTTKTQEEVRHIYLRKAQNLRADLK
ncbi:MAG: chorismate mutase [Bacillota bacterium]|nr:chorismate mutase [Bacillota bacterium]